MPPALYPNPLPEAVRRDFRLAAEVRLYDALAASLPPGFAAFHGVSWLAHNAKGEARNGEADYVIAHQE